jgi:hypothetical protein
VLIVLIAAIDCLGDISDGMIIVERRHTNFSSHVQIYDSQLNSAAITHFRLLEPLSPLCGNLEFRGTHFEKHRLKQILAYGILCLIPSESDSCSADRYISSRY